MALFIPDELPNFQVLLRPNPEGFVYISWKKRKGGGTEGRKLSRRYTHRGACWESNAHLWLWNMGQRPERTL